MHVPKFAIACGIAVIVGTLAGFEFPAESQTQDANARATPTDARSYRDMEVRLPSGKTVGRVFAVMTDSAGRTVGFEIASADRSNAVFWLGAKDLRDSRSGDAMITTIPLGTTVQIAAR